MEILLAAMLSCSDGKWILDGLAQTDLTVHQRHDMVMTIIESMPDNCPDGSYTPGSRP